MLPFGSLLVRLRALFRRDEVDRELDEELKQHLELETTRNLAAGMSAEEARNAAQRDMGNTLGHHEAAWEAFGWSWLEEWIQDLRHAARVLVRNPGFAVVTILILGIGIGSTTTMFAAIHGILIRPLPYRDPDRLVALWEANLDERGARSGMSAAALTAIAERSRTLDDVAAYRPWGFDLSGAESPERVRGARVSGNLFSLVGTPALLGRTLLPDDGGPGGLKVVLLSEELWRRRFGADPRVLGASVRLSGEPHTVVGVLRGGFELPEAELWVPLVFASYELDQRGDRPLSVIGRLRRGITFASAQSEMRFIGRSLAQEFPASNAGWSVATLPLREEITGAARTPLLVLFAAAIAILLVACANATNLLLARSATRRREIALCAALGASRFRITRRLVTESLLIVTAAGTLGLAIATIGSVALSRLDLAWLPRSAAIRAEPIVFAFGLGLCLLTAVGLSVLPARDVTRLNVGTAIRAGSLPATLRGTRVPWRDVPVVAQIAVALFLLVGGGLLLRSFVRAHSVDLGFSPHRVLSMYISLPGFRYPTSERIEAFFDQLRIRSGVLPSVRSAALASHLPLAGALLSTDFAPQGIRSSSSAPPLAHLVSITPGYFETMGIPIHKGRAFGDRDRAGGAPVVVIDETLARRFWPRGDAVGRRLRLGATLGADSSWREIVGVVGSVRSIQPEREPEPTIYVPHAQNPWPTMGLVVRTTGDPGRLRNAVMAAVRALDPEQPVTNVRTLDEVVGRALAARRLQMLLIIGSAAVAFLLAVIGVYGMMTYALAQRTRELGIRVALGASRRDIVRHCLRQGLTRIGAGTLIGGLAAVAAGRLLRSLLFGLEPWDPVTFAGAILLLGSVGLLACYLPAARAARTDPVHALRLD